MRTDGLQRQLLRDQCEDGLRDGAEKVFVDARDLISLLDDFDQLVRPRR